MVRSSQFIKYAPSGYRAVNACIAPDGKGRRGPPPDGRCVEGGRGRIPGFGERRGNKPAAAASRNTRDRGQRDARILAGARLCRVQVLHGVPRGDSLLGPPVRSRDRRPRCRHSGQPTRTAADWSCLRSRDEVPRAIRCVDGRHRRHGMAGTKPTGGGLRGALHPANPLLRTGQGASRSLREEDVLRGWGERRSGEIGRRGDPGRRHRDRGDERASAGHPRRMVAGGVSHQRHRSEPT